MTTARGSLVPSAAAAKAAAAWREMAQVWGSGDGSSQVRSVAATWSAFVLGPTRDPERPQNGVEVLGAEGDGVGGRPGEEAPGSWGAGELGAFRQDC